MSQTKASGYILLIFAVCITPLGVLPYLGSGISYSGPDSAELLYHVKQMAVGRVPYIDTFTHHFVAGFYPLFLLELICPITPFIFWILVVVWQMMSVVLAFSTVRNISNSAHGLLAAIVVATIGWFPRWYFDFLVNQAYYLPFIWAYIYCVVLSLKLLPEQSKVANLNLKSANNLKLLLVIRALLAGFLALLDQRLLLLAILDPFSAPQNHSKASQLRAVLLILLPSFIFFTYLGCNGAISAFFEQTVLFPLLSRNATESQGLISRLFWLINDALLTEGATILLAAIGLFAVLRYESQKSLRLTLLRIALALLFATALGGRNYINYLLFLSPIICLLLALLPFYIGKFSKLRCRASAISISLLVALYLIAPIIRYFQFNTFFIRNQDSTIKEVTSILNQNPKLKSRPLVWGYAPQIYLYTDTLSPFPDISLLSLVGANFSSGPDVNQVTDAKMTAKFYSLLADNPPSAIIDYKVYGKKIISSKNFFQTSIMTTVPMPQADFERNPRLEKFKSIIEEKYRLIGNLESEFDSAKIYGLKD